MKGSLGLIACWSQRCPRLPGARSCASGCTAAVEVSAPWNARARAAAHVSGAPAAQRGSCLCTSEHRPPTEGPIPTWFTARRALWEYHWSPLSPGPAAPPAPPAGRFRETAAARASFRDSCFSRTCRPGSGRDRPRFHPRLKAPSKRSVDRQPWYSIGTTQ